MRKAPRVSGYARLSLEWNYRGMRCCLMESDRLRVTVLPDAGGKVHELIYKPGDTDVLYHHPRVEPRPGVFGANADNWWSGGIDDVLPTSHPCRVDNEDLPFLGELWSLPWSVEQIGECSVQLSRSAVITPVVVRKTMTLYPGQDALYVSYTVSNVGSGAVQFLWGIHPCFPISEGTRVTFSGRYAGLSGAGTGSLIGSGAPSGKEILAFGKMPTSREELRYVDLSEGRLSVWNGKTNVGVAVHFPLEVFPVAHLWIVDGGWRGLRCIGLEPWTGYPARLDEAIRMGHTTTLASSENLSAEVAFRVWKGPSHEKEVAVFAGKEGEVRCA